jgi:hypothetical protein
VASSYQSCATALSPFSIAFSLGKKQQPAALWALIKTLRL